MAHTELPKAGRRGGVAPADDTLTASVLTALARVPTAHCPTPTQTAGPSALLACTLEVLRAVGKPSHSGGDGLTGPQSGPQRGGLGEAGWGLHWCEPWMESPVGGKAGYREGEHHRAGGRAEGADAGAPSEAWSQYTGRAR